MLFLYSSTLTMKLKKKLGSVIILYLINRRTRKDETTFHRKEKLNLADRHLLNRCNPMHFHFKPSDHLQGFHALFHSTFSHVDI